MAIATIPLHSCISIDIAQIELLQERGFFDKYEVSNDKTTMTLYWTTLKGNEEKVVSFSRARTFESEECLGKAFSAHLYYNDEHKLWIE
mmetsp:Transcript_10838/g.16458  ORF Transcript_10838/g.16458 Transcript_10838/m.16458 type:complete len:89 (+) Transcript_10838:2739-3005(+)